MYISLIVVHKCAPAATGSTIHRKLFLSLPSCRLAAFHGSFCCSGLPRGATAFRRGAFKALPRLQWSQFLGAARLQQRNAADTLELSLGSIRRRRLLARLRTGADVRTDAIKCPPQHMMSWLDVTIPESLAYRIKSFMRIRLPG